jgi:ornithine--oxo-acid transaminase
MGFSLAETLASRGRDGHALWAAHGNPQMPRVLHALDFDRVYVRAKGAELFDAEGRRYLDFLGGFGVFALGRNHPVVAAALREALDAELADLVQLDCPALAGVLAERLVAKAPGLDRVYWCNSGTESVEAALKFARCATGRKRVVFLDHAYHGLTVGSLSVNGNAEFREGFDPLLPDSAVPLGDLDRLERELAMGDVAAFVFEPIQGKGVYVPPPGYLPAAVALCRRYGTVVVADEVQTGIGRTGRFFAYEHEGIQPDLVCVAKALSGGFVPVGALLGKDWIFQRVYASMDRVLVHDSTFGSNAMAMVAGLATLAVMEDESLVQRAEETGKVLRAGLEDLAGRYELVRDVRGRGLMVGIEFGAPRSLRLRASWQMLQRARRGLFAQMVVLPLFQRHRILTQVAGDHIEVVKLLPPLVVGEAEVGEFLDALEAVMADAHRGSGLAWDFGRTLVRQAVSSGSGPDRPSPAPKGA